jgi:protease-4
VEGRKAGTFNVFMKNFITSMLGALVALVVFATGAVLLFIGFIGAIVSVGQRNKVPQLAAGSYLVFDLATNIVDAPPPVELGDLTGERTSTLQLRSITRAIRHAAHDEKIKGILLLGNLSPGGYGTGYAALREVRAALNDFRESKKPVIAYIDYATVKDYYLASAANEVVLDPYGMLIVPGIASQPLFLAGAFEKYGIGVQVTRVGKYKSYVEEFTRTDMSPENREQIQKLLDDIWGTLIADIGRSRSVDPKDIQEAVDAEGLIKPAAALKAGLIDKVAYRDEIIDRLKKETGVTSPTDSFKQVQIGAYAKNNVPATATSFAGGEVAVIYAEGEIVEGEGDQTDIGGAKFAREIRKLREDASVKAIVLRVNSPGGSATAAETIQREIRLARKVKPVVVSMGSYAASGGYWISAFSDRIFAEPTTITGSIGVFGIQFNIQKLANDHGVTFDSVKTGRFADSLTITRPQSPEELAVVQKMVDWIYGQFIAKVAEGRKLPVSRVEEIAQGRVWSGTEAKKIGLVDEIGGLEAAVKSAAGLANLGEHFHVVEYPRPKNLSEAIAEMLGRFGPASLHLHSEDQGLVGQITARIQGELAWIKALNDPNGVYARMPVDLAIH